MKIPRSIQSPLPILILIFLAAMGYLTRQIWIPWLEPKLQTNSKPSDSQEGGTPSGKVILSDQTLANLGLIAQPIRSTTYWKKIQIPGMIIDRPGRSDRGIVSPVTGVIHSIHHFPGDTVRSGEKLFIVKLLSESIQSTQSELFKTTQEIKLAKGQLERFSTSGAVVSEARIIEVQNQLTRLETASKAYRQELQNRGLLPDQIDAVTNGKFVTEISISIPNRSLEGDEKPSYGSGLFEIQDLKVDLGQQVQAGQTLCLIANHQQLAIEGQAFRDEMPLIERATRNEWSVEIDFGGDYPGDREAQALLVNSIGTIGWSDHWSSISLIVMGTLDNWFPPVQSYIIRQLSNNIDPDTRTFAFRIPLENQARITEQKGRIQTLWRYRPGQKVRVRVPVEKLQNVFVLPTAAVTRDGTESFIFTQNVNTFERISVRVWMEDRYRVVLMNDGSLIPGSFVVQSGAAQLNRMVKSQSSTVPKGYHMHADGSLHKNDDEDH